MKNLLLLYPLMIIIFNSCEDELVYVQTGPSIEIIQPSNNTTVSDTITIIAKGTASRNIIRAEIFINHEFQAAFQKPPYEFFWYLQFMPDGSQHIIEAKAYDEDGNSGVSKPVIVYCYRFMPSGLSAVLTSDSTVELFWIDNCKFETGFEIEYKLNNTIFNKIADTDSNTTFFTYKKSFDQNANHYFRIRAKSKDAKSGYSNTTLAYIQVQKPTNLSVLCNSDTTAQISWKDNTTFENSYLIQMRVNNNYINLKEVPANTSSTNISFDFVNNVTYEFRVAAVVNNYRYYSDALFMKYSFYSPDNLSIEHIALNNLRISWNNRNNFNTRYLIERKINDLNFLNYAEISPTQISYIDTQIDSSNKYTYKVSAYTRVNVSEPSSPISAACLPYIVFNKNIQTPESYSNFDLSKDEQIIAICNDAGYRCKSYYLSSSSGSILKTFVTSDSLDAILSHIGINYNNSLLATGSYGKYLTFWNANNQTVKKRIYLYYYLDDLVTHPTRNILFTSGSGKVVFWDFDNTIALDTISSGYRYGSIAVSHNGNLLAISGSLDKTKIIDIETGNVIKIFNSYGENVKVRFSKDDNSLIIMSQTKLIIIDIYSAVIKEYFINNYGILNNLALHPAGIHLILTTKVSEYERWFVVFNLAEGKVESVIPRNYGSSGIRFISNGNSILSMGDYTFLTKWDFYPARWQKINP